MTHNNRVILYHPCFQVKYSEVLIMTLPACYIYSSVIFYKILFPSIRKLVLTLTSG